MNATFPLQDFSNGVLDFISVNGSESWIFSAGILILHLVIILLTKSSKKTEKKLSVDHKQPKTVDLEQPKILLFSGDSQWKKELLEVVINPVYSNGKLSQVLVKLPSILLDFGALECNEECFGKHVRFSDSVDYLASSSNDTLPDSFFVPSPSFVADSVIEEEDDMKVIKESPIQTQQPATSIMGHFMRRKSPVRRPMLSRINRRGSFSDSSVASGNNDRTIDPIVEQDEEDPSYMTADLSDHQINDRFAEFAENLCSSSPTDHPLFTPPAADPVYTNEQVSREVRAQVAWQTPINEGIKFEKDVLVLSNFNGERDLGVVTLNFSAVNSEVDEDLVEFSALEVACSSDSLQGNCPEIPRTSSLSPPTIQDNDETGFNSACGILKESAFDSPISTSSVSSNFTGSCDSPVSSESSSCSGKLQKRVTGYHRICLSEAKPALINTRKNLSAVISKTSSSVAEKTETPGIRIGHVIYRKGQKVFAKWKLDRKFYYAAIISSINAKKRKLDIVWYDGKKMDAVSLDDVIVFSDDLMKKDMTVYMKNHQGTYERMTYAKPFGDRHIVKNERGRKCQSDFGNLGISEETWKALCYGKIETDTSEIIQADFAA